LPEGREIPDPGVMAVGLISSFSILHHSMTPMLIEIEMLFQRLLFGS
jgi:hypothetical protein